MTEDNNAPKDTNLTLDLKLPEPDISADDPWKGDVLNRKEIAGRLTNLIRTQSVPFVVSVHGAWGTGKTFMLKRWQKQLEDEGEGFQAIYFNAWDDDFCHDPLIAIIGQLTAYFNKSKFNEVARKIGNITNSLIRRSSLTVSLPLVSVTTPVSDYHQDWDLLQEYLDQRKTKDTLRAHLQELSAGVFEETGRPLVFIIDELDRCRPTFAIELLERVKHVFDVPCLVFVFGINRDELCQSLKSVYGDIDADTYLRRFFDIEFMLPEAGIEAFCNYLFEKFQLDEVFASLSKDAGSRVHSEEFRYLYIYISKLWSRLGLSLRDIENCVRLVALLGRNLNQRHTMYPGLVGVLIALKSADSALYREFVRGDCTSSAIVNFIDKRLSIVEFDDRMSNPMDEIEVTLYSSDSRFAVDHTGQSPSIKQLDLLYSEKNLTAPQYLSNRTRSSDKARISRLYELAKMNYRRNVTSETIAYLTELIDMHQDTLRI